MSQPDLQLLKRQLQKLLGRDISVEKLRSGKFICKYLEYGMHPLSLVGATEEEAYQKLLAHLKSKTPDSTPPPTGAA